MMRPARPHLTIPDRISFRMSAAIRTWSLLAFSLGYLLLAHLALSTRSPVLGALAVALLAGLTLTAIRGRFRWLLRVLAGLAGMACIALVARGGSPVPLLLPPLLVPVAVAWMFARTLLPGRTPLVERLARGFHAPLDPPPEIIAYTRTVTWAWVWLLVAMGGINAFLIANLSPGGLLALSGREPRWPVSPVLFAWFSSTGTYLLIGGMLVLEFAVRVWRFPNYRFRNPADFLRQARERVPGIIEALRHG
jgi:uncharacterized membrane protein